MTVHITLVGGTTTAVDARDADLGLLRWYKAVTPSGSIYVMRREAGGTLYLHRAILKPPAGSDTDHTDGNTLNNRRQNLRVATRSQNLANTRPRGKLGLKGVWQHKGGRSFYAKVKVNGKQVYQGRFDTAEEAARAYDREAKRHHGEFAWLNYPD